MPPNPGKLLVVVGLAITGLGVAIWLGGRLGLGRLPGDIVIRGERSTFYFPVVTCLVVSVVLSLLMWLIQAGRR